MRCRGIENWKWGIWAALAITLLSVYPQLVMWGVRGQQWNGSFAENDSDEWFYAAYIQALIDGRPRRNNPYTGSDDYPDRPQPESQLSIQFVPAYLIAFPARFFGLSSSTAFIVLGLLAPFFSCLAIFWLIENLIKDPRLAAAGALIVVCFGALAAGQGVVTLLTSDYGYSSLLFLRRYEPLAPFPLFFLFCAFVWKAMTAKRLTAITWAVAGGFTFGILVFSYFYLWTSAAAWLVCVALLWFIARPGNLRQAAGSFFTILVLAVAALVPYVVLLSKRSPTMDSGLKLALSHAPDLFRIPELLGIGVITLMVLGALRGRINWRAPDSLFAASFSLMPLVVFNQQVITGRSLQPFHYEVFIANYAALVGVVLAVVIAWRGPADEKRPVPYPVVARLAFVAILWAVIEIVAPTKLIIRFSEYTDRAAAVCQRLQQRASSDETLINGNSGPDPRPLVLASDYKVALILPVFAPQALLWESHFEFLNLQPNETTERFYKHLYYIGIDGNKLTRELGQPMSNLAAAAFGHERVIPGQSVLAKPITSEEIAKKVTDYEAYTSSFSRDKAVEHLLSYVIVPADGTIDLSNLDRWYQREKGEHVGDHLLYRVHLRQ
ncbi:MAG: hypothetical protein H0U18_17515 [Pyrinomonadaceae bacterium]|jgi:hypothetical protein|nr:hypothetical protein [Pyrinomonadaceae bacterium]